MSRMEQTLKEKINNFMRLATARQQTINRMKSHLAGIDERECSLDAWNAICDALGEVDNDDD